MIIHTHGQPIIDPVYALFEYTLQQMDPVPVLLERDYNFDDLPSLAGEMDHLRNLVHKHWNIAYETEK